LDNDTAKLTFDLKRGDGAIVEHHVPFFHYLLEGSEFKNSVSENTCVLALFRSNTNYQENLVVGYNFMKQFYVIYDGSDLPSSLQIGIARRNRTNDIGQIRYEPNYIGYERAEKAKDTSKIQNGYAD
jgi:hypothetical protein